MGCTMVFLLSLELERVLPIRLTGKKDVTTAKVNAPLDLLWPQDNWQGPLPIDPPTLAPLIECRNSIGASAPLATCYRKGKRPTAAADEMPRVASY